MSIRVVNIHKSFDDRHILKGIDFEFELGRVNMIIGASGSGKTVLLKTMVGLLQPDTGEIWYAEQNMLTLTIAQMRTLRRDIGMLFQSSALFDSQTVFDNIAFPLRMFTKQTKLEIEKRVHYCLDRVNMPNDAAKMPSELSGGMKKRVGIARAIALNPKYLFCDEPNSGLDPKTAAVIDQLIHDITYDPKHNMTTIVVTHDMKSVLETADRVMFLYKGFKEWEGTRQEILSATNEPLNDFIRTSGLLD
jgi:phospholipid/cholesterol/gamma-HCH transport system ATP-binding protein